MTYKILFSYGDTAIAETISNFILCIGYDSTAPEGQQWGQGIYFAKSPNTRTNIFVFNRCFQSFLCRINEKFIHPDRLGELCTRFKDCCFGNDDINDIRDDLSDNEADYLGIDEDFKEYLD